MRVALESETCAQNAPYDINTGLVSSRRMVMLMVSVSWVPCEARRSIGHHAAGLRRGAALRSSYQPQRGRWTCWAR